MKAIKTFLQNQIDIYMMVMLEEYKKEGGSNLANVLHWNMKIVILSEELKQLNDNDGKK